MAFAAGEAKKPNGFQSEIREGLREGLLFF
jgi:hypothetical protein